MSQLLQLNSKTGRKRSKRVGRGNSSGHGNYSGRGVKGQKSRTGGKIRPGFEGGQTPFYRKLPKYKGFRNLNRKEYQVINVADLNVFGENEKVTPEKLFEKKLISKKNMEVKLLGDGKLEKSLTVSVHKASKSAIEKIEALKGKIEFIEKPAKAEKPAKK